MDGDLMLIRKDVNHPQTGVLVATHYFEVEPEENAWNRIVASYFPAPTPIKIIVQSKILQYRSTATQLLTEMYAENTLAGISVAQSDELFDEYMDVIIRIQQGAFPTALYRLGNKVPSGFVTQALIDAWSAKIKEYL